MPVPVDEQQVRDFAHGLAEVLVIEEKNPTLELLVKSAMYDSDERPRVVGRHDESGALLVPGHRDARRRPPARAAAAPPGGAPRRRPPAPAARSRREPSQIPLTVNRTPFYCSGCPHNVSTRVPEGTLVGGGIGCHAMVALMEPERVGDIAGLTAMGNEGAQWIGMAPFVDRRPPRAEPRRRHVLPLRLTGRPRRRRGRRRHHLQAALQRHGGDDRRPGPAGSDDRARGGAVAAARGRQPDRRHVRPARQVGRRRLRRRARRRAGSRSATGRG